MVAGEQLGAGDHRVVESIAPRLEFDCAPQMVDENIGVDEKDRKSVV